MDDGFLVVAHVPAGAAAVASGAVAMLAEKGSRVHRRAGRTYLVALAVTCLSGSALALTRWPHFPHLLALGALAGMLAARGYAVRRRIPPSGHLLGMGMSYVVILTAFYVDNGPKLPLWNRLPQPAFWVLPSLVALPLLVRALRQHAEKERT